MARKKRAGKKTRKKKNLRRKLTVRDKIKIVFNKLLFFIALSLISLVFYRYIQSGILEDLFFIMAMVFGFISVGFLIVLIILSIIKAVKKR